MQQAIVFYLIKDRNICEVASNFEEAVVIIISANNYLFDKLKGLDLGADDYLSKPFHSAELNARIKAVLHRGKYGGDEVIKFHEIKIDTKSKSAFIDDKKMTLTKKE